MFDSYGREIAYLRVSVTDRCNLRCVYCMPPEGVEPLRHEEILTFEEIAMVVGVAVGLGFRKVRLTGGEPLARKGIASLVRLLRPIRGLETLAMTTNGTLLAPLAAELARAGLDSVNISLDTLDPPRYARLTRGGRVEDALAGIKAARAAGLPVKLNVVVLDGDEASGGAGERDGDEGPGGGRRVGRHLSGPGGLDDIRAFAAEIGARVQTIARYRLDEEKRERGEAFDRPPRCGDCDRLRLLANGTLRPCLHGSAGVPVDFADIEGSIRRAVGLKPARGLACADLAVGQIGG